MAVLTAGLAFADGGILTREPIPEKGQVLSSWVERGHPDFEQRATLSLPDSGEEVDVFVLRTDGDSPPFLYVSAEDATRVFSDLNGDGVIQADEIHEDPGESPGFQWEDFDLPYPARDSIGSVRVGMYGWIFDGACRVGTTTVKDWYRGKVRIDGKDYEASLVFRTPLPKSGIVNEVVILDTDGDGVFQPFLDQWVASEGIAYFNERLWTASTVFSGSEAELTIRPYTGPTGKIEFTGKGVNQVHVLASAEGVPGLPEGIAVPVRLPARDDAVYELPPGACSVFETWLEPEKVSEILYHGEVPDGGAMKGATAALVAGGTASMAIGGPLTSEIATYHERFSREFYLQHKGCTNPGGLTFYAVVRSGTDAGFTHPRPGPPYEVHTSDGRLVASGNLDYG